MPKKEFHPDDVSHWLLYRRLLQQLRPYSAHLAALFLLSLLSPPLALLVPLPLKLAVDSVIDHQPLPRFLNALVPESLAQSSTTLLMLVVGLVVMVALLGQIREFAMS